MIPIVSASFSIVLYLVSSIVIYFELRQRRAHTGSLAIAWLAAIFHTVYNATILMQPSGIDFNFFNTASLILLIVVLLLLTATLTKPVGKLGIALFPLVAAMLGLSLTIPIKPHHLHTQNLQMDLHVLTSIIAFSLLNIAAFQAVLLAIQDRQLRNHMPLQLIRSLPPLQTMESLLFRTIAAGMIFLSISLISGFIFIEDLFAQHLVHKTVLSIFAWLIFTGLLIGRQRYGWRGKTAIRGTLIGFASLLLAYFGSKLVLELILKQ